MEIRKDPWLSNIFGYGVFFIEIGPDPSGIPDGDSKALIRQHSGQLPAAMYYAKIDTNQVEKVKQLQATGLYVVDVNVTLGLDTASLPDAVTGVSKPSGCSIEEIRPEHCAQVLRIAAGCFRYSRFHLDPQISKSMADRIKEEWIQNYIRRQRGEQLFVATVDQCPVGFLAVLASQRDGKEIRTIDLMGVDGAFQGKGLGKALVAFFIDRYKTKSDYLEVGTQAANIVSMRLYQRCGFSIDRTRYVMHGHVGKDVIARRSLPVRQAGTGPTKQSCEDNMFWRRMLIVAEIGNNHEGNFEVAKTLIRKAKECGVDAVKFQTFKAERFVSPSDPKRFQQLKSFELSQDQFVELSRLAHSLGLLFFSTPLDLESTKFLAGIVDGFKVASGDNNFYPLIDFICSTGKPLIVSTGLSDLEQVVRTKRFIEERWRSYGVSSGSLVFLHCVSSYPVPLDQANLAAIPFLAQQLGCPVGYSDHTLGTEACVIAAALETKIIEKHFTLDKQFSTFRDHQISADPIEMKKLVERVARTQTLLGRPEKNIQPCEAGYAQAIRRSVVAATDLALGHCLTHKDLTWIRPADGLAPGEEGQVVGRRLKKALQFGDLIRLTDLESDSEVDGGRLR